jgi:hypothetical protein
VDLTIAESMRPATTALKSQFMTARGRALDGGAAVRRDHLRDRQSTPHITEDSTMTEHATPVTMSRAFTEAWTSHDMDAAAGYLADDVVFDGPASHSTGMPAYLTGLSAFAQSVTGMTMLAALGDDTQALIMYEVTTLDGTLICAEHHTFRDGKLQTDRLTFAVRKVTSS